MYENSKSLWVRISEDEMTAYLTIAAPLPAEGDLLEQLKNELRASRVVCGIDEHVLQRMITEKVYHREIAVAFGITATDGQDGWYEYNFRQDMSRKPQIREDGTVDYWSVNLIETVVAGQVIAIYKPAIRGKDGITVTGKEIKAKPGKELSPLKGRGFERNNDNLTYIASIDGKIEMVEGRININNFYEIFGNADLSVGNIDFAGDVLIHGNVCMGVSVRAGGTVTVDGVVEGAKIWAGKEIVLRGGVLGDNKAEIFSKGSICARFLEYAKIEAYGSIQADSFLLCEVECRQNVLLTGKKGVIIGGHVHAIQGIEVNEIGNNTGIRSWIEVGVGEAVQHRMKALRTQLFALQEEIEKVDAGLKKFDALAENSSARNPDIRTKLLRVRIRDISLEKEAKAEWQELSMEEELSRNASVKVNRVIYPGAFVVIGYARVLVKEEQTAVEYVRRGDKIILKGEEIVG